MKAPRATEMAQKLRDLGLDVRRLPRLRELSPKQLRDVMELFRAALGVRCTDCHADAFEAPTRRKVIAGHMWDDFVRRLGMQDGAPVFCDSCHQGHLKQLDRRDKGALAAAMDACFVDQMKRTDGQDHKCTTCHVSEDELTIFDKWK